MVETLCSGAIQFPQVSSAVLSALPAWFSWNPVLSYVAAVLLLVIGVSIAIQKAPPQTSRLDKIVLCGPVFIAVPLVVFGLDHYFFPAQIGRIIPAWIPAHAFWVYFVGTCLILGSLSIVFRKYAGISAGLFGIMLLCFEALMNIPGVVAQPHSRLIWTLSVREFAFSWGALSLAAMHTPEWKTKGTHWLISVARMVLGAALTFFAAEHFLHPELLPGVPLTQLTPDFIPAHLLWGYLTAAVYGVAGICLLIDRKAHSAATGAGLFVLFVVIFFCVPYMLQYPADIGKGLNVPADTLLLSGGLLCLAASLRESRRVQAGA